MEGGNVDAAQCLGLPDLALYALGMRAVVDRPNFAVLAPANDSLFRVYGPGSPDNFCAILPKAGADGGDYACQFFRAPDSRIYAIVENRNCHVH
jgi:hypothetical protein